VLLSFPLVAGAPVAQLDRASASGAEGHRFKSCQAHQTQARDSSRTQKSATDIPGGPLAQLVEQLTLNQRAVGSTPTRPTKTINYLGRDTHSHFLKSAGRCYYGVNTIQNVDTMYLPTGNPACIVLQCNRRLGVAELLAHIQ
jgi:hypothetical protein